MTRTVATTRSAAQLDRVIHPPPTYGITGLFQAGEPVATLPGASALRGIPTSGGFLMNERRARSMVPPGSRADRPEERRAYGAKGEGYVGAPRVRVVCTPRVIAPSGGRGDGQCSVSF